jgi:hypothetical protein
MAAVLGRRAVFGVPGRTDVYAVSDYSRGSMRGADVVAEMAADAAAMSDAVDGGWSPRRASDAEAVGAMIAARMAADADASPLAYVGPRERVFVCEPMRAAEGCRDHGDMANLCELADAERRARGRSGSACTGRGAYRPARGGIVAQYRRPVGEAPTVEAPTVGDAFLGGYVAEVLAVYRTENNRPGDVLVPRAWSAATALAGGGMPATRTALHHAAKEWAATVRGDVKGARDDAGAASALGHVRAEAEAERIRQTMPEYVAEAPRRLTVGAVTFSTLGADDEGGDSGGKSARRWAMLRGGQKDEGGFRFALMTRDLVTREAADVAAAAIEGGRTVLAYSSSDRYRAATAELAKRSATMRADVAAMREQRALAAAVVFLFRYGWTVLPSAEPASMALAAQRRAKLRTLTVIGDGKPRKR